MTALRNSFLAASALLLAAFVAPAAAQHGYYAAGHYAAPQAQAAYAQQQAAAYAQNQAAWAAYYRQQQANAQAWAAYHAQQAAAAAAARSAPRATPVAAPCAATPAVGNSSQIRFDGRFASVGASAPAQLQHLFTLPTPSKTSPTSAAAATPASKTTLTTAPAAFRMSSSRPACFALPSPPALSPPMAKPAPAASSPSGSSLASMFS